MIIDYFIMAIAITLLVPTGYIVIAGIIALPLGSIKILIDLIKWYRKGAWA